MQASEIRRTLEFGPVDNKLSVLGQLCLPVNSVSLSAIRPALDRTLFTEGPKEPHRLFAARALLALGDRREEVTDALISLLDARVDDDKIDNDPWAWGPPIRFPWLPRDIPALKRVPGYGHVSVHFDTI